MLLSQLLLIDAHNLIAEVPGVRLGQAIIICLQNKNPKVTNTYEHMLQHYNERLLGTDKDFFHWENTGLVLASYYSEWVPILDNL